MSKKTMIIGAGASGLATAIHAAQLGKEVTLVERLDRVGKKILSTGNGRCNLYNEEPVVFRGDNTFAQSLLAHSTIGALQAFFASLGLVTRLEEGGRVYPASGHGGSVLDVLRLALDRYAIKVIPNTTITRVQKQGERFIITDQGQNTFTTDQVVVAGGGKAAEKLGSNGSTYPLLTSLGHHLTHPLPALVPLITENQLTKGLAGIRAKALLTLVASNSHSTPAFTQDEGEVLFTPYGLSGIAAMSFGEYLSKGGQLSLNLLPTANLAKEALLPQLLMRRDTFGDLPLEHFFTGLFQKLLGFTLFKAAGIGPLSIPARDLKDEQIYALAQVIENFPITVTGTKGFDQAQVTAGGIEPRGFSPQTMESKVVSGLYATGEVLNVHGPCGGYNLLFAFASGLAAARGLK